MDELAYILDQMQDDIEQDEFLAQQIDNKRWYLSMLMDRAIMPDELINKLRVEIDGYTLIELIDATRYVKEFLPKSCKQQFMSLDCNKVEIRKPSFVEIEGAKWIVEKEYEGKTNPQYKLRRGKNAVGYFAYNDFKRPWYYTESQLKKTLIKGLFSRSSKFKNTKEVKACFYA